MELYNENNLTPEMEKELSKGKGKGAPVRSAPAQVTIPSGIYSNSPLVTYTRLSPNCNTPRNHAIDTITIHMVWGQCTVEALGAVFAPTSRQASSNYGIGYDGRIGMYAEEKSRAWTSSSAANDNRAVTIETASDTFHPYAVTDKAYASLITLCADICRRNGKTKMVWCGSLAATNSRQFEPWEMRMTVHSWFADTLCPGQWLMDHMQEIADKVSAILAPKVYPKVPFSVKVLIDDLNVRKGPGTNHKSIGYAAKGNHIIDELKNGWGYITNRKGWIYLENSAYVKIGGHIEVSPWKDVKVDDPYYKIFKKLYDAGIMKGTGDKFKPKAKVTRQQMAIALERAIEYVQKK